MFLATRTYESLKFKTQKNSSNGTCEFKHYLIQNLIMYTNHNTRI